MYVLDPVLFLGLVTLGLKRPLANKPSRTSPGQEGKDGGDGGRRDGKDGKDGGDGGRQAGGDGGRREGSVVLAITFEHVV